MIDKPNNALQSILNKSKVLIFTLPVIIFLGSCSSVYRPVTISAPLLQEQHHTQVAAHTGNHGTDIQGSYAPINNLGIMVNYNALSQDADLFDPERYVRHRLFEGAAGYWKKLGDDFLFEAYGGYGHGTGENNQDLWASIDADLDFDERLLIEGSYHKFFIQPGIAYVSDYFDIAFHMRFVKGDIYKLNGRIMEGSNQTGTYEPAHFASSSFTMVEPVITMRAGYKFLKFQAQAGASIPTESLPHQHNPFMISFGLVANLQPKFF